MKVPTYQLLAALGDGRRSAAEILGAIRRQGGAVRPPSLASFYRHLNAAVEEGWVEIAGPVDGEGGAPGRPGQAYRLTRAGRGAVREEARRLRELAALVDATRATR